MKKVSFLVITCISILLISNCNKTDYAEIDEEIIQQYIRDNNLSAQSTGSGLHYVIENSGTGDTPNLNSTVTVAYTGRLIDGTIFDESDPNGISFPLSGVIHGWQQGIPLFKEGGSGILLIPSALGYGSQAVGSIPSNSVLIFDIHLLDVD